MSLYQNCLCVARTKTCMRKIRALVWFALWKAFFFKPCVFSILHLFNNHSGILMTKARPDKRKWAITDLKKQFGSKRNCLTLSAEVENKDTNWCTSVNNSSFQPSGSVEQKGLHRKLRNHFYYLKAKRAIEINVNVFGPSSTTTDTYIRWHHSSAAVLVMSVCRPIHRQVQGVSNCPKTSCQQQGIALGRQVQGNGTWWVLCSVSFCTQSIGVLLLF